MTEDPRKRAYDEYQAQRPVEPPDDNGVGCAIVAMAYLTGLIMGAFAIWMIMK